MGEFLASAYTFLVFFEPNLMIIYICTSIPAICICVYSYVDNSQWLLFARKKELNVGIKDFRCTK